MNNKTLMTLLLTVFLALPMTAQVRFGVRGGITLGEMRFQDNFIDSDNRIGYTGGLLMDLNIPILGIGAEVSAMYTHRNDRLSNNNYNFKRHYIEIPVYLRYQFSLPAVKSIVAPYIFTGPSFSILFNEDAPTSYKNSKTYLSLDVGAGVDLFKHLRLSASYDIGLSKAAKYFDDRFEGVFEGGNIQGKDNHWTINAAYIF